MAFQNNFTQFLKEIQNDSFTHALEDIFVSGVIWEITAGLVNPALTAAIAGWNTTPAGKALYNTTFGAITGLAAALAGTAVTYAVTDFPKNPKEWKTEHWKKSGSFLLSSFGPEFLWQLVNWSLEELDTAYDLNDAQKYAIGTCAFFTICALSFHALSHVTHASWKSWSMSGIVGMSSASFFWFASMTNTIPNLFAKSLASGSSAALGAVLMRILYTVFTQLKSMADTCSTDCYGNDEENRPFGNLRPGQKVYDGNEDTNTSRERSRSHYDTDSDDNHSPETTVYSDALESLEDDGEFFDAVESFESTNVFQAPLPFVKQKPIYFLVVENSVDLIPKKACALPPAPEERWTLIPAAA